MRRGACGRHRKGILPCGSASSGDRLVAGVGDPRSGLGRSRQRASTFDLPATFLTWPCPPRRRSRWPRAGRPVLPRLAEGGHGLVIGVGPGRRSRPIDARSRPNLANITDRAAARHPQLRCGSPPLAELRSLKACHSSCSRCDVANHFCSGRSTSGSLAASLARGEDGAEAGHTRQAWIVQHQGWYEWTGTTRRTCNIGMSSNNPYAPPTGSEPALPEGNLEAAGEVHHATRRCRTPSRRAGSWIPIRSSAPRTGEENLDLPTYISEAHTDSRPTAPAQR